jgi:hypothetical protein
MAYSYVVYTGNGVTTSFTVPFPYLDQSHVSATVNGVATTFVWLNATTIGFSAAPGNGLAVRITRFSNREARLSDYQDAQVLTEAAMDFDARQIFYVAQEAFDAVADAPTGGDMRRSMNLSDVFDTNAARQNIGALNRNGDNMLGPLYLAGFPTAPNQAATKGYVDSILGIGGGVTSFNGRIGVVTLTSGDISFALGYTPLNKAGDVMTGLLTLSGDPIGPLGAVTKQYVDAHLGGGSTGEWVFPLPDPAKPAAILNKSVVNNTSDRAGSANILVERIAGSTQMVSWMHTYTCDNPAVTGLIGARGDIGVASIIRGRAATFIAQWAAAVGPRVNPGQGWAAVGMKVNAIERVGDQGLRRDRTGGSYTMGIQVSPDASLDVGDGSPIGYNGTFGLGFIASGPGATAVRWWNPLYIETDSTVPNGIQVLAEGGSAVNMSPLAILEARGHYQYGLDFRVATFNDADHTAIWLQQGQCIHLGPFSRIYEAPTGDLTLYDPVVGAKRLQDLGGGSGTNLLPLNNNWSGQNSFAKINTTFPGWTVQVKSEGNGILPAGYALTGAGAGIYYAAFDVRKTTNAAIEQGTPGGSVGAYIQHAVSGNITTATTSIGMRCTLETSQTRTGLVQNDAVAGYFSIANAGTDVGAFGLHVDTIHVPSAGASSVTYGMSVELYRFNSFGNTIGYHARVVDQGGGSYDGNWAFLASPGGIGGKKWKSVFAAGSTLTGTLVCDIGLDLAHCVPTDAAIRLPGNTDVKFNGAGETANMRYGSAQNTLEVRSNGALRIGMGMGNGVLYQYGGVGAEYQWYFDAAGSSPAVMNVRSGSRTSAPSNPSAIANWLKLQVDGIDYWWPLYR